MGFFDDLKVLGSDLLVKGSVVAKDAAQKAQDATEMGKIKLEIATKDKAIRDLYMKIGKAFYEQYKEDASEFTQEVQEINKNFAEICELKSKYAMYKDAMSTKTEAVTVPQEMDFSDAEDVIDLVPAEEVETIEPETEDIAEDTVEAE